MSEHDPLCPEYVWDDDGDPYECRCDLIAEVRADERERIAAAVEAAGPGSNQPIIRAVAVATAQAIRSSRRPDRQERGQR